MATPELVRDIIPRIEAGHLAQLVTEANRALLEFEQVGVRLNDISEKLNALESERASQKQAAITRLIEFENPATPGKRYSQTQANDFALLDPQYMTYKQKCQELALLKLDAEIELESARYRMNLSLAVFRAEAGLLP